MRTRRLELPDGQWAELLIRPRHAEYVAIKEAIEDAMLGRGSVGNVSITRGREFTKAWHILDPDDGSEVPFGSWDGLEPDISEALCTEADNRWFDWDEQRPDPLVPRREPPEPKSPAPTSSSSAPTSAETPSR